MATAPLWFLAGFVHTPGEDHPMAVLSLALKRGLEVTNIIF
jgi:hypothetical protein